MLNAECHILMPPRDEVYAACDARFLKMVERGALEETLQWAQNKGETRVTLLQEDSSRTGPKNMTRAQLEAERAQEQESRHGRQAQDWKGRCCHHAPVEQCVLLRAES